MYVLKVRTQFSSAHNLRGYSGKCEELHGHNWHVEVAVCGEKVDDTGMVIDFSRLKKILSDVVRELDHKYLNELTVFKENNPTSENIAGYIYAEMSGKISGVDIKEVTVWETDSASATYSE